MKSAIHAKRKTDAIIAIRQDNTARQILITNMNRAAEQLVGYNAKEAVGKPLNSILAPRVNDLLSGYLEFGSGNSDFAVVARRIPNFQILSKKGIIVSASLKVFNLVGQGENIQEYELLMRDITLIKKIDELKEMILTSEGSIEDKDPQTGLPSINSIVHALDTSYSFLGQHSAIEVCFALIEIGNIKYYAENYGEYVAYEVLGTLGHVVNKCCRNEDIVGYMGDGVIGMVLIDCNLESAKIVINRIKKKIDTSKIIMQNGQPLTLLLSISYTQVRKEQEMVAMIDVCEAGLDRIARSGGEGVVQA